MYGQRAQQHPNADTNVQRIDSVGILSRNVHQKVAFFLSQNDPIFIRLVFDDTMPFLRL